MKENILKIKNFAFAIRIVKLCLFLEKKKNEHIISKQLFRSGTAIGALINEAEFSQSKADFISKMSISLKETNESCYWIKLLQATSFIEILQTNSLLKDCEELKAMLISSIKTAKGSG